MFNCQTRLDKKKKAMMFLQFKFLSRYWIHDFLSLLWEERKSLAFEGGFTSIEQLKTALSNTFFSWFFSFSSFFYIVRLLTVHQNVELHFGAFSFLCIILFPIIFVKFKDYGEHYWYISYHNILHLCCQYVSKVNTWNICKQALYDFQES